MLSDLVGQVTEHGNRLDRRLVQVELLLESLTESVVSRLELPSGSGTPAPYLPRMLGTPEGPADVAFSERYNQVITRAHPVWLHGPDVDPETLWESRVRLADLGEVFEELLLRSVGKAPSEVPRDRRPAVFQDELHLM